MTSSIDGSPSSPLSRRSHSARLRFLSTPPGTELMPCILLPKTVLMTSWPHLRSMITRSHQRGVRLDQAEEIALLGRGVHTEHHLRDAPDRNRPSHGIAASARNGRDGGSSRQSASFRLPTSAPAPIMSSSTLAPHRW